MSSYRFEDMSYANSHSGCAHHIKVASSKELITLILCYMFFASSQIHVAVRLSTVFALYYNDAVSGTLRMTK